MHVVPRTAPPGPSPAWRARTLEQLERLVARVERDRPPLAEPRLALLRRSREWLVRGEPPEPAA
jgi:hypothetical protein